ncbi:hypothetical protein CFP56_007370 [Quercus suber]|uniref:Uncharacterized protein n=1 Tax=Quercus suber TaxID=58331 RepID=A0AAW0L5A8_QUESU
MSRNTDTLTEDYVFLLGYTTFILS